MDKKYITTYQEVLQWRPPATRDKLRSIALQALALKDRVTSASKRYHNLQRVQFLYLHHVFKDEEQLLEQLLQRLSHDFEFISYSEAVSKVLQGTIDKPYLSFSFDDGMKNNLRAAEILDKYKIKACFFINPAVASENNYDSIKTHCHKILDFPTVDFLNWDDVGDLLKNGHEIGSHTMSHINVARSQPSVISDDMKQTIRVLTDRCGETKHFAFPYGQFKNFTNEGRKAVFAAGYKSCASGARGCHINHDTILHPEQLCIRRDHVVLAWGLAQVLYFITNNARNASTRNNLFPALQ